MKKIFVFFIICFLFCANFSFASSRIDFNNQVNQIITLRNDLDRLLDRYADFLNNYPDYDSYEIPSEIAYLNSQLSVYQSHLLSDLTELRELYVFSPDLEDRAKIGGLYSILTDYLMAFNYLRLFNIVEDKLTILFLANEYKSSADKKLNLFIENYIDLQ